MGDSADLCRGSGRAVALTLPERLLGLAWCPWCRMWSSVSVADGKALVDEHANITAPAVAPETP